MSHPFDQDPPHDRDAERALLAGIMRDPDRYLRVGDTVDAADFYLDAHQKIYLAVESIHRGGDVPDLVTVASELRRAGHLADVSGDEYLADLFTLDATGANVHRHAGIVRDHAIRRKAIHAAKALLRDASDTRLTARQILDGWGEALAGVKARADQGAEQSSDFEFVNLSTIKAKPVKWSVPGRFAKGCVTLIGAFGGLGKSTLVRHYIAAISKGRCAFGMEYEPEKPGNILMVAAEDDFESTVIPHLVAEGADLSRIDQPFFLQVGKGNTKTTVHLKPEHIVELREHILKLPVMPHTLYIDPIASLMERGRINDSKATEVRSVLDPLTDLAQKTGMTVIVVAHMNKGAVNGPAANRIAGSRAYTDAVRCAFTLGEHPDDPDTRVLALAKPNIVGLNRKAATFKLEFLSTAEAYQLRNHPNMVDSTDEDFAAIAKNLARVVFGPDEDISANDLAGAAPKADGSKLDRCIEWLRGFLKEFAYPSVEIEEAAAKERFGKDTLWKARTKLKDEGLQWDKDGLKQFWWGMGPVSRWNRRPEPDTSLPSKSSGSSGTSGTSDAKIELPELPELHELPELLELLELTEVPEGSSRSVTEHLEDEKARTKPKRKSSKRKPKAGAA